MKMEELSYVLTEMEDLSATALPLKTTSRIKYTCFSVSPSFLVFGATSGGLYVFRREPCVFLHLIPNKEGAINQILVSPDEKLIGFATVKGTSCVVEVHGGSSTRRILSSEHVGAKVTALQWHTNSSQLYVGDDMGIVSVISITSFMGPTMFQAPSMKLMHLDSQISQMDCCCQLLLVSTLTRCYLCDTMHEQYRQIGTRLRDGHFGACFYNMDFENFTLETSQELIKNVKGDEQFRQGFFREGEHLLSDDRLHGVKLFCARPGSRLWEVRIDGTVLSTHQFKKSLAIPPSGVIRPPPAEIPSPEQSYQSIWPEQSFNFCKLFRLSGKFLFTFQPNGIYVFNPINGQVVLWSDVFKRVVDAHTVGDSMYLWMGESEMHAVSLVAVDKFLVRLYLQKKYRFCSLICASFSSSLMKQVAVSSKLHLLVDLLDKVGEEGGNLPCDVSEKVSDLLKEVSRFSLARLKSQKLQSGIFIVGNAHLLSQNSGLITNECVPVKHSHRSKLTVRTKFRSQSSSPDPAVRSQLTLSPSSNSLPELLSGKTEAAVTDSDTSNESFDPFPDLPLSAITSPETVAALRELGTSVSETITSGKRSLKEKWQVIEGKLRGQETYPSTLFDVRPADSQNDNSEEDQNDDSSNDHVRCKHLGLDVSFVVQKCEEVSNHAMDNGKCLQDLRSELLSGVIMMYEVFRNSRHMEKSEVEVSDMVLKDIIASWLAVPSNIPFPFSAYFSECVLIQLQSNFHSCLKQGILVYWLRQMLPDCEISPDVFPFHVKHVHSKEDLVIDVVLSRILQVHASLLDATIILQCLDSSGALCLHVSWNTVMDHFQKAPMAGPSTETLSGWPLPRILNAMMVVLKLGQVESCRGMGEQVPVKHVLRLVLRLESNFDVCFLIFLTYMEKLPESRLLAELKDKEISHFTVRAFEKHNANLTSVKSCPCNFPLGKATVSATSSFPRVGAALITLIWQAHETSRAFELCLRTRGMWSQILLHRRSDPVTEVLPLLLHLGDEQELNYRLLELSHSTWEHLIELKAKLSRGLCLGCNESIDCDDIPLSFSWASLSSFLLRGTDSETALQILTKYSHEIPPGEIGLRFYQSCLASAMLEEEGVGLGVCLLDHLSSAVPVMSPVLAKKLDVEPVPTRTGHHWGFRLRLKDSSCRCCLLPLSSPVLLEGSGLIAFECGHAFHSVCVPQGNRKCCLICVK